MILRDNDENNLNPKIQASKYVDGDILRVCPHCSAEKPMSEFGYRDMGEGEIRNQSWCKTCRGNS